MIQEFWQRYLDYRERQPNRRRRMFQPPVCGGTVVPGDTPEECDHMLELMIEGQRKAEIRSLYAWQDSGTPLPGPDEYTIALGSDGQPRCVLRSAGAHIVAFRSMPEEYAMLEGVDLNFRDWQLRSRARFLQESKARGIPFNLDMPIVVNTFEVVYWEE